MNIKATIVDDEKDAITVLLLMLKDYLGIHVESTYLFCNEALLGIEKDKPDLLFLDINMPGISGLEMAKKVTELSPDTDIVFISEYSEYALKAWDTEAVDFILKPIIKSRLDLTVQRVVKRYNMRHSYKPDDSKVFIRCLGKFEVMVGDGSQSISWRTNKEKELMAYLVCNYSKPVTKQVLSEAIFAGMEEKKAMNYLYVVMCQLRKHLEIYSVTPEFFRIKNDYSIEIAGGICDYIDMDRLIGTSVKVNDLNIRECERIIGLYKGSFLQGEYYAWADSTRDYIDRKIEELILAAAQYYRHKKDWYKMEWSLIKLIGINNISEEGYKMLLDLYIEIGNKQEYRKYYEKFERMLDQEFSEHPSQRFVKFYDGITKVNKGLVGI